MMYSVFFATLWTMQWVAFTSFVPVKSYIQLSLDTISNVALKREISMHWDKAMYKKEDSLSLKCGSVNGGDYTKQPILLNNVSEKNYFKAFHLQLRNY